MKKNWKSGVAAVLVLAATAIAGTPGTGLVNVCITDLGLVETAFLERGAVIVAAAEAKLTLLDSRGVSDKRLTEEAAKFQLKLDKLELDCIRVANKTAQKCFVRLANLDEDDLIQQITDVDTARDEGVDDIEAGGVGFENDVAAALAAELGD
jgi:hypothetical protein